METILSKMNKMLTVGKVARKLGLNPQTIYFYERIGLIPSPQRSNSGYRLFGDEDLERLSFIGHAKTLGMSLKEIKEVLALEAKQSLSCCEVNQKLSEKIAQLQKKIHDLQKLQKKLITLRDHCNQKINDSQCNGNCTILRELWEEVNTSNQE